MHDPKPLSRLLRYDLPASLVVFLVAVPLSLGIAIASGALMMAGLIAGVVGGIVAGALGGSPLQVSGPAAPDGAEPVAAALARRLHLDGAVHLMTGTSPLGRLLRTYGLPDPAGSGAHGRSVVRTTPSDAHGAMANSVLESVLAP